MRSAGLVPQDEWRWFRCVVLIVGCLGLLAAASGLLAERLFHQPTTIKYAATVIAFLLLVVLAMSRHPLRLVVGLAILVGPINAVFKVQGTEISPLLAVDILGAVIATPRYVRGRTAVRTCVPISVTLLLPGILISASPGSWLVWLSVTVVTGWLAFLVACEPSGFRFVVGMLIFSAFLQSGLAFWEFTTKHQLYLYSTAGSVSAGDQTFFQYGSVVRPQGTFPDPIGLGQFLALCLPLGVALAASFKRRMHSILAIVVVGVMGLALILSLSRLSIVGGGVGLFLVLALLPPGKRGFIAAVTIVVAVAAIGVGFSAGGQSLRTRLQSILNPTGSHVATHTGDIERVELWRGAIKIGETHLLAGVGLGNFADAVPRYGVPAVAGEEAQNTPLQYFAEAGLPGLIAILLPVCAAFRDLYRSMRGSRIWTAGLFSALIATLLTWSTDVAVRYVQLSGMVAVLFGLIIATRLGAETVASGQPA